MRVLLAACDNSINADEKGQSHGEGRLDCNQDNASDSLCGLSDAELFDKDENAGDRENADNLDEDVDDIAGSSLVRATPDEEAEH